MTSLNPKLHETLDINVHLNDFLIKGKLPTQFYTNCQFKIFMGSLWEREREAIAS